MANRSVLQIVRSVAPRLGLLAPSTATGSTDLQIQQLLGLVNEEGKELAARFAWQELTAEQTFASVVSNDQGRIAGTIVPASAGFLYILNDTIFNRTTQYQVGGPISPRTWQALKGSAALSGFYAEYRIRGGHLLLYPAPTTTSQTLAFEYVTENWVSNAAGDTFRAEFTMDDDVPLLDSRVIELGLKWRWKNAKGLAYSEEFENYENAVIDAMTRNATARPANMDNTNRNEIEPLVIASKGSWPL